MDNKVESLVEANPQVSSQKHTCISILIVDFLSRSITQLTVVIWEGTKSRMQFLSGNIYVRSAILLVGVLLKK